MNQNNLSYEQNFILEKFKEAYSQQVDKKIVLYGAGANTKLILDNFKGLNFIGIMDPELTGTMLFGQPVLSKEEVKYIADIIVIVAREKVVPIIYERIKDLEKYVLVLDISGKVPTCHEIKKWMDNDELIISEEKIVCEFKNYDIISFDVFDTLLVRQVLYPSDIFMYIEKELENLQISIKNFKQKRMLAEQNLAKYAPTIYEIYYDFMNSNKICTEVVNKLIEMEIECETTKIKPRKKMIEIVNNIPADKTVYFLSDMYLSHKVIYNMLQKAGIDRSFKIILSCDYHCTKESGKLFRKLPQNKRGGVLHIGDNLYADIKMAKTAGISAKWVPSIYQIIESTSMNNLLSKCHSLDERSLVALVGNMVYDNPFNMQRDYYYINSSFLMGYSFIGPIVYQYLAWLAPKLLKSKIDKMVFFGRDGFLFYNIYINILRTYVSKLPEAVYIKISRRAVTVPCIDSEEDIEFLIKNGRPFYGTLGRFMEERFGIEAQLEDSMKDLVIDKTINTQFIIDYVLSYKKIIFDHACEERKNYLLYLETFNLENCERIAVMDFVASGTAQYYIEKLLKRKVVGYYFATTNLPNNYYKNDIESLYGNFTHYKTYYNLFRHYLALETIFTDFDEMMINCNNDGTINYSLSETKKFNDELKKCHEGIEKFVSEYWPMADGRMVNLKLPDSILGILFKHCRVSEKIKNAFTYESQYDNEHKRTVFEGEVTK